MPNQRNSAELDKVGTDRTGFGALIIPRTAFQPATKNVASG